MNRLKKVLLIFLLTGITISFLSGAVKVLQEAFVESNVVNCCAFGISTIVGAVAFSTRKLQFLHVFLHETSHMVASAFSGQYVYELYVSANGNGHVRTTQTNIFVSLAPYSVSLGTILLLVVANIVKVDMAVVFVSISGFMFGDHVVSIFRDLRPYQPDTQHHGFVFSICYASLLNLFSLTTIALLLSRAPFASFEAFIVEGGERIIAPIKVVRAIL